MIQKLVFLLTVLSFSYCYGNESNFDKIVSYLKNNQPKNHKLSSIAFKRKELVFFKMIKRLNALSPSSQNHRKKLKIDNVIYSKNCLINSVEAESDLIAQNTHNKVLKVTYIGDAYVHYYAEPFQIKGCNLILVYEETFLPNVFPGSGAGTLRLFEVLANDLHLIELEEIFHMD